MAVVDVRVEPGYATSMGSHLAPEQVSGRVAEGGATIARVPKGTDLVEWYFEQGWTDGLPVVPPTASAVDAMRRGARRRARVRRMPGAAAPRQPHREVLAINMVMAGCKPEYAPVVRAAMLALTAAGLQPQRRAGDDAHGRAAA